MCSAFLRWTARGPSFGRDAHADALRECEAWGGGGRWEAKRFLGKFGNEKILILCHMVSLFIIFLFFFRGFAPKDAQNLKALKRPSSGLLRVVVGHPFCGPNGVGGGGLAQLRPTEEQLPTKAVEKHSIWSLQRSYSVMSVDNCMQYWLNGGG